MGIPDSSLLDLIVKVRSWLYWGEEEEEEEEHHHHHLSSEFEMPKNNMCCCDCRSSFVTTLSRRFLCQSCGRSFCDTCVSLSTIDRCRLCSEMRVGPKRGSEKVHPSSVSPDPPSPPRFSGDDHFSRYLDANPSLCFLRSDEEDTEDSGKNFSTPKSEYYSDTDSISTSGIRNESFSSRLAGPSHFDTPSRIIDNTVQKTESHGDSPSHSRVSRDLLLKSPDLPTHDTHEWSQRPLDFENNGLLWYPPPPPEDENDEADDGSFRYDDDDDDDYLGDSGSFFSSSGGLSSLIPEKDNEGNNNHNSNEPVRAVVHGHFRALVSQLLQGEGIQIGREKNGVEDWLDIVTAVAWQAASFVKPDTSRGGSMDPGDYVRVKCIATGSPSESALVKGVVCTKNIKHKRMTSQYKNPRLIILGGALEYQRVPNQLASFNTLLQQENDHLKMIISRIEALRPNVLLVEKSVSSYAQEYLLTKEISLVLNFKRPLLERIARCTGALITPSVDSISTTRLGNCELFRLERFTEEHEPTNQFNKKPIKTLMFFEGCSRRLGCTVLLKGASREELKKVKHVVQYAVFAAYHLSLETSFLADEGATLPKMSQEQPISTSDPEISNNEVIAESLSLDQEVTSVDAELEGFEPFSEHFSPRSDLVDSMVENIVPVSSSCDLASNLGLGVSLSESDDRKDQNVLSDAESPFKTESRLPQDERQPERTDENEASSDYFSAADTHQSILVSFSSHCVLKGTVCERSQLMRIKFYGSFDKPLGRYLRDDLFEQTMSCRSCKEPPEAHVLCYTHQQGNLTINVRTLPSLKLPGERDGKIWMWHRCLRCDHVDGVPPATRRVVMSDAAWGLSFGKFLELSFSNHATANRIASCGHSLQKDCLRYYGFGSTVAFFRYSPIDILSVYLPPSVLEFSGSVQSEWFKKEATQLMGKVETLYAEISEVLDVMEGKSQSSGHEQSDTCELEIHIVDLKDLMKKERNDYIAMLQPAIMDISEPEQTCVDILELNRLRRALLIGSHVWDRRFYSLDSLLRRNNNNPISGAQPNPSILVQPIQLKSDSFKESKTENASLESLTSPDYSETDILSEHTESNVSVFESCVHEEEDEEEEERISDGEISKDANPSPDESTLSDRIDSAWTGTESQTENLTLRRLGKPVRVHSFDSALRVQEKIRKGLNPSSSLRSFRASNEFRSSVIRTYSQILPQEALRLNSTLSSTTPSFISSASDISEGVQMLLRQSGQSDLVVAVYDQEPTSIISYALSSKEYDNWIAHSGSEIIREDSSPVSTFSAWQSFGTMDLDYMRFGVGAEDPSSSAMGSLFADTKKSPHLRLSFGDEKMKFSVTCYFAEMFDSLRSKCCPGEVDFVRSLSRCRRWSAQGGKSNVYFAKSLDERFIVKQVTKTELDSFEEFAPEYFKYLTESINSGSPTCLAKVLGIYQVCTKQVKGGKETKMDMMVMENLFFKRNITRIYDLKGSARSRYNSDTTGANSVLLDMNLLETLRTKPIFLGSKAKRILERAIWNDTAFLAFVDVMDYSLLVGVDEERKELVLGIIDFMRQYTWDKHLETWVKASGILGGPKNASPTIISPIQYKKRFRKAMTTYFLTVPDQWSS